MLNVTLRTPWVKRMRVRFKKGKEEGKSAIHTMQENAEVRNLHRGAPECGHCKCAHTSCVYTWMEYHLASKLKSDANVEYSSKKSVTSE